MSHIKCQGNLLSLHEVFILVHGKRNNVFYDIISMNYLTLANNMQLEHKARVILVFVTFSTYHIWLTDVFCIYSRLAVHICD